MFEDDDEVDVAPMMLLGLDAVKPITAAGWVPGFCLRFKLFAVADVCFVMVMPAPIEGKLLALEVDSTEPGAQRYSDMDGGGTCCTNLPYW